MNLKSFNISGSYDDECKMLVGNSIISAAFITYCGYFDQVRRVSLLDQWKNACKKFEIPFNYQLSISEFLSPYYDRTSWLEDGLKNDKMSIENATILSNCSLYPLIIDPSGLMSQYLMKRHKNEKIVKTTFQEPNFQKVLENSIRFGSPLLIEDVEVVDPMILSLLGKEVQKTNGRVIIRLGSKEIDFCPNFRLYLVTKNPNIVLPPEICSRAAFINFTVTRSSLKNEILDMTLEVERPDISQKRQDLLKLQGEYQVKLRVLEDQLLESLNASNGNILNDESVITHLENLQLESIDLLRKSQEAEGTLDQIECAALNYSDFSHKCSEIFFLLERFTLIDRSYQFSLEWFLNVFSSLLQGSQRSSINPNAHLDLLFEGVCKAYYDRVAISLLKPHRLVLLFGLYELKNNLGDLVDKKWTDFLLGNGISGLENERRVLPDYIPEEKVDGLNSLLYLPGFEKLTTDLTCNELLWGEFFSATSPIIENLDFFMYENGMIALE